MAHIHDIGDRVTLTATFTDTAGVVVDPSGGVTCAIRSPDGTESTASVTNPETGTYTAEVEPTSPGIWSYRFVGTGSYVAAEEGSFRIRAQRVGAS